MNENYAQKIILFLLLFLKYQCGQCHADEVKVRTGSVISRLYHLQLISMLNIIDEDVDPCEDFFAHACGYYNETMNEEMKLSNESSFYADESFVSPYLYNYQDRMHFFERNKMQFVTHSGRLLRGLYTSCNHRKRIDKHLDLPPLHRWHRLLKEIPFLSKNAHIYMQWPLLRHEWLELESQNVHFDWMNLAAELGAHGVATFVHIFFAENTIYVAPVRADEDVYCLSMYEWRRKLSEIRGNSSTHAVDVLANELQTFCRALVGENDLGHKAHAGLYSRKYNNEAVINGSFIYNISSEYFQLYFRSLELSEEQLATARVIYIQRNRLHDTAALIQSTHPNILFNFVLWQAYWALKYDDCFLLTEEFEDLLLSEYWNWNVFKTHFSRKVALATYIYHTSRFQEKRRSLFMAEQWDRFLNVQLQRSDFNLPRLLSAFAKTNLDPSNLTIIYGNYTLEKVDFYRNLLYLRRRKLRQTFLTAFIDFDDCNHPIYFLRHFLHFTILLFQRPLFHYFATLGFDLWYKSDLLYSSDGYYTALDCLERQTLLSFETSSTNQYLDETQVADIFRFHCAFLESLRDYNFWLEGESFAFAEDFVLEHFHLTSKRVLFYAVAQLYCGRNDVWYSLLINKSFMNMPQFGTAFECDAVATMNPLVKCMIT
ncbi:uncharacterized protein [Eurosta solidaginis]|uniref:uncharacterized protein n=1 Tax=Eurosta solidaginis TaxID=178769 RepID=UPI003530FC87